MLARPERLRIALSPEQIQFDWSNQLSRFFGEKVNVPYPPSGLMELVQPGKEQNWKWLVPVYLPAKTLRADTSAPGWYARPQKWFWESIQSGNLGQNSLRLPGAWMFVDLSPKTVSEFRHVSYPDDPLGPLLMDLRERKRLKPYPYQSPVPSRDSRFGLQISEVQQVVLPESAEKVFHMRKGSGIVRLPNYLELNVIGNMYPGLLTARRMGPDASDTWEYFGDPYQNQDGVGHLYGMRSVYGPDAPSGLSQVGPSLLSDYQSANMGFRPFIIPEQ